MCFGVPTKKATCPLVPSSFPHTASEEVGQDNPPDKTTPLASEEEEEESAQVVLTKFTQRRILMIQRGF